MWPFSRCNRYRHAAPRVVGLGVEIRGDIRLNDLKPYVRFYLECKRCGATGDKLREAVKTYHKPDDLILDGLIWDEPGEAS
jgi:hypothetical protein